MAFASPEGNDRNGTVCLIRPPAVESFRFVTTTITAPLGLAYIAAALEQAGKDVRIIDAVAEAPQKKLRYYKGVLVGLGLEEIAHRVPAETKCVGISVIFTHEWPAVVRLISLIKQRRPDVDVILGGEHITSMPEFCLATSNADYIVCGEGEESIVELLQAIDDGADLADIHGVGYRVGGQIIVNPRRHRRRHIDDIPYPAWHLFNLEAYNDSRLMGGMDTNERSLPLLATRGCPYQCTFCSSPNMWTPRWIPRDPEKVVDEIDYHHHKFGATSFPFQDLTAIIQKEWIVKFCKALIDRGLKITWQFPSGTRSEAIDAEVAGLMKRSGMVSIAYAPESGSEHTRKLIKKKMQTGKLFDSIRASAGADLNVACFLIVGFPHDTSDLLRENVTFLRKLRQLGVTDLGVGYFFALPGTELFDSLYDAGKIKLNQRYFAHILQGGDLVPSVSHCEQLSRLHLILWKLRFYLTFYGTRRNDDSRSGLLGSVWRALTGIFRDHHDSKLQTVFRTAMGGAFDELRTWPTRGWLSRKDEAAMFKNWDAIFAKIRLSLLEQEVTSTAEPDTSALHQRNVMLSLKPAHRAQRILKAVSRD